MKIVIAPDSFKGSLTSVEASRIINRAIKDFDPLIETAQIPMADGGEGTAEAVLWNKSGEMISCPVLDPLGREIKAGYGWIEKEKTAVIETAAASGLPLLTQDELDPEKATSYGTGQLIKDALDRGAETIIIGLGGSATIDAGTGLFEALGVKFFDEDQNEMNLIGGKLQQISAIDISGLNPKLADVEIITASDVTNPLLGENGAIAIFGPQKGVEQEELTRFERGMQHFSELAEASLGRNMAGEPGSGAAGGIGFLLRMLLPVKFRSGLQMIAEVSEMDRNLAGTDLVLTGEGKIDGQSLYEKVPVGIGRLAKEKNIPVIAFAGSIGPGAENLEAEGIHAVMPIVDGPLNLEEAMLNSEKLLYDATLRLMRILYIGKKLTE
ncbi:glycerate kinase [Planococcus sp. CAU13]|uniref:glycerate kinase n=1 Tax=Planococcus sp. CAU13 TaxID=1541197 RepID=UPI00052FE08D|nr:glycerate kinase [Planococcus sp. CAU13]